MAQARVPPIPAGIKFAGKTVIVTGGNTGMGYEAARQFLILQASRVIIAVRSDTKGQEAISALRTDVDVKAANPSAIIEAFHLDLDDFGSGLRFAQKCKQEVPELDILLCNGGINLLHYEVSKSGHERTMQVNCYTHFLIVLELLALLRATSLKRGTPSRLTFVSSSLHPHHGLNKYPLAPTETTLAHFDNREIFQGMRRYIDSKFALNAFAIRLATAVPSNELIVNSVCPGSVRTGLERSMPVLLKPIIFIMKILTGRTAEEGARTLIYASAVAGSESHGKFIQNNKVAPGAPFLEETAGKEFIERFWTDIAVEIRAVDPTIEATI